MGICKGIPAMEGYQSGGDLGIPEQMQSVGFWVRLGAALQAGTAVSVFNKLQGQLSHILGSPARVPLTPWKCPQGKRLASLQCPSCPMFPAE